MRGGEPFRVLVWTDPTDDGDPSDAVLLAEAGGIVDAGSIDTDVLQSVPIDAAVPAGNFFVGASVVVGPSSYPAPEDATDPQGRAWIAGAIPPPLDPNVFQNLWYMEDIGLPGNWLLRADLVYDAPPSDCNTNLVPDECDIGTAWGGFCTGPDCSRDCNDNDVPDECEELIWCDLNGNGVVEDEPPYYDYWLFIDALGACQGNPKYNACADHDGDGCVTLLDYCDWVDCFREANGKDWVPPPTERKNPAPRPVPAVPARPAPVGR